jgi:hypothetical protein
VVVLGYATAAVVMATAVTGPVPGSTYTHAHTPQDERCMRARPCTLPPAFPHDNTSRTRKCKCKCVFIGPLYYFIGPHRY